MAHKTLTISEEAYEALVELKKEGESFTELVKRITAPLRKKKLSEFAGIMAGPEYDDFEKAILELRRSDSKSMELIQKARPMKKSLQKVKL